MLLFHVLKSESAYLGMLLLLLRAKLNIDVQKLDLGLARIAWTPFSHRPRLRVVPHLDDDLIFIFAIDCPFEV